MVLAAPVPVAVLELPIEHLELAVLAAPLVKVLTFLQTFCEEFHAFCWGFEVVANSQDGLLAIFSRVAVYQLDYDVGHEL